MLLSQTTESCHIVIVREIELALTLLVDIPEHIDTEGVHAQRLTHLDAMFPIRTGNTGIMHLGCLYQERFAIQEERLVANCEIACHHQHGKSEENDR